MSWLWGGRGEGKEGEIKILEEKMKLELVYHSLIVSNKLASVSSSCF